MKIRDIIRESRIDEIEQITRVSRDFNFLKDDPMFQQAISKGSYTGTDIAGHKLFIYKHNSHYAYFLKTPDNKVGAFLLLKYTDEDTMVSQIFLDAEFRGQNIAIEMYKYPILKQGITIASDEEQTIGSKKLWAKLARTPGINVYGWNVEKVGDEEFFSWDPEESPDDEMYSNEKELTRQKEKLVAFKADVEQRYADGRLSDDNYAASIEQIEDELSKLQDEYNNSGGYKTRLIATKDKK